MENLDQFNHQLPAKFKELCEFIISNGFRIGVIGGVTRDFILASKVSTDIDCEIRPIVLEKFDTWPLLFDKIKEKYNAFEELPYNILRIKLGEFSVEISLPRLEEHNGSIGHSNFDPEFIPDIDYKKGFDRRDLTINSIMFEFNGKDWKLIDPFNGLKDLNDKVIRNCSSHFFFDPVRFLRAIRFAIKFKFEIHPDTLTLLETMKLNGLTSHYLKTEFIKSNRPLYMLKRVYDLRPEALDGIHLQVETKSIVQYDKLFDGDLESHLRQAVFLSVDIRSRILEKLNMSNKALISSIPIQKSWKSLATDSFKTESFKLFTEILSKLESLNISNNKLEFLLSYFELDFTLEDFSRFKDVKYELSENDKKIDQNLYRFLILQKRLKELL
jgi:tRNA nucleotidyltransferase/poly(A) polymerase